MLHVNGTLTVKKITGAKGAFSVGDLVTEEGTFKVKDALLDQFEEGRYQGEFAISSIYLSSYIWRGKSMTDTSCVDVGSTSQNGLGDILRRTVDDQYDYAMQNASPEAPHH